MTNDIQVTLEHPFSIKKRLVNICRAPEGEEPCAWPLQLRALGEDRPEEEHSGFSVWPEMPCRPGARQLPAILETASERRSSGLSDTLRWGNVSERCGPGFK